MPHRTVNSSVRSERMLRPRRREPELTDSRLVPDRILQPRESRPACRDVAVTRPRLLRADPEGVEFAIAQVEAETHGLPRQPRQVASLPRHLGPRAVLAHRHALVARQP